MNISGASVAATSGTQSIASCSSATSASAPKNTSAVQNNINPPPQQNFMQDVFKALDSVGIHLNSQSPQSAQHTGGSGHEQGQDPVKQAFHQMMSDLFHALHANSVGKNGGSQNDDDSGSSGASSISGSGGGNGGNRYDNLATNLQNLISSISSGNSSNATDKLGEDFNKLAALLGKKNNDSDSSQAAPQLVDFLQQLLSNVTNNSGNSSSVGSLLSVQA